MKQLLVDYLPFEITANAVNESIAKNSGKLIVTGILQRAEAKNQNGRIYPKDTLVREAKKYTDTFIKQHRALGELDHPESSVVNLQNASHNITEMGWSGDNLIGTVEVLGTPAGNILKELFKAGIKLGISSRGLGSVETVAEDDGGKGDVPAQEVQPDFELIAFDFVSNPSTQGAFMFPMKESVNKERAPELCDVYCKTESIISDIISGV
jgi:hypothetical protein|tara:strand:- start:128 stop:757 length:630 start_codon:yes stop_codon:yes gene_type:complete